MKSVECGAASWRHIGERLRLKSRWVTVVCDQWQVADGVIDYWRVERPNSVVVVPWTQSGVYVLAPNYRPGIASSTTDFPGGRWEERSSEDAAYGILKREVGLSPGDLQDLRPVGRARNVDSSFSSQQLMVYSVKLIAPLSTGQLSLIPIRHFTDFQKARASIDCLQCSSALTDWYLDRYHRPDQKMATDAFG